MKRLTEHEKLECAEYVLDILEDALIWHGEYEGKTGDWLVRAKEKVRLRLGQYLDNRSNSQ